MRVSVYVGRGRSYFDESQVLVVVARDLNLKNTSRRPSRHHTTHAYSSEEDTACVTLVARDCIVEEQEIVKLEELKD